jgi:glycosyltransferase involved in cell wall biosynthesis
VPRLPLATSADPAPLALIVLNNAAYFLSHRLAVAEAIRARGCRVGVVAPPDDRAASVIRGLGFDFHPWQLDRGSTDPRRELAALIDLCRIYRRLRPRIVHHLTPKGVLYGSLAARWAGVPARVNALVGLGHLFGEHAKGLLPVFYGLLQRACHRVRGGRTIFQNPDDLSLFVDRGYVTHDQARLIRGSGVDPAVFSPDPEVVRRPIVLLPSRMLTDKGVDDTVAAIRLLRARGVACELWLAGDTDPGNPRAVPEARLKAWNEEGIARWLGHVDDMVTLYRQCRLVCLPSYYREGVPKALIEAASCAVPIVTTDAPGCREIVVHDRTGLLVPPRAIDAIAAAIGRLLGDVRLAERMGQAGRSLVEREFALDRVVRATMAVYGELDPLFA